MMIREIGLMKYYLDMKCKELHRKIITVITNHVQIRVHIQVG